MNVPYLSIDRTFGRRQLLAVSLGCLSLANVRRQPLLSPLRLLMPSPPSSSVTFPSAFWWGTATSSYQIEGAWNVDNKGESIWDRFAHTPGTIAEGETGDVACDHYHHYLKDVQLMQELNLNSYRFSLSWPRILPSGRGKPNQKGLDFYSHLIDALLEANIRPFPTLYHWDLPQALEDRGGWTNRDTAERFADYAATVVQQLGDRVSNWMLLNEPYIFTRFGYLDGTHAPGKRDWSGFLRATHTTNLAQGMGYRAIKAVNSDIHVGSANVWVPMQPSTPSEADVAAAERAHAFINAWYHDPALKGAYPKAFRNGLPSEVMGIQDGDMDVVRADYDFLGLNIYSRAIAGDAGDDPGFMKLGVHLQFGGDGVERTDIGWEVYPESMYESVTRVAKDYGNLPIEITENGASYNDEPDITGSIGDRRRIEFYRSYLTSLSRAIDKGIDVRGFHAWSLLDNLEWAFGYEPKFGIVHVDFDTLQRTVKQSGHWYARVAKTGVVEG